MSDRPAVPLVEKVRAVDRALAEIPHAFGGALSLAYYAEPRATVDIDVNVFVSTDRVDTVLGPLRALGVKAGPEDVDRIRADGQTRIWWDGTPIDLFFAYDPFHDAARGAARRVPFGDTSIPILSAEHLMVCKAIFDRSKDWVDLEAIVHTGRSIDVAEVLRWVGRIAGDDDPRYERIAALVTT